MLGNTTKEEAFVLKYQFVWVNYVFVQFKFVMCVFINTDCYLVMIFIEVILLDIPIDFLTILKKCRKALN